jgi:hypothetical protein
MSKLTRALSEYFLGTETRKMNRYDSNYWKEFSSDMKNSKKLVRLTRISNFNDLFFGKAIPNLIDLASIVSSIYTKNPTYFYGAAVGEGIRILQLPGINKWKKVKKNLRNINSNIYQASESIKESTETIERLINALDQEGEDWKNPK